MNRDELTRYLDEYLRIAEIQDDSRNGLQVEGRAGVRRVALAVDACLEVFRHAGQAGTDLLIVHHGLFWASYQPLVGALRRRIKTLLDQDLSLYAVHLPLDAHPEVGNNAALARRLGLEVVGPFGEYHGVPIGLEVRPAEPLSVQAFAALVREKLQTEVTIQPYGPEPVQRIGIVSGGGALMIGQAAKHGLDLYLTGERSHSFYHAAAEHGIHVLYAGHYATESYGLRSLGQHLEEKFGLETTFIDLPTGL